MSGFAGPVTSERADVVNRQGRHTGLVLDLDLIHLLGLNHLDMHAWITNGTHFLQQQRHPRKLIMPDTWDISVSGHIQAGETPRDGAQRETNEETGLDLPLERFIYIGSLAVEMDIPGWKQPHRTIGHNFVVMAPDLKIEDLRPQEGEVLGFRWYPLDQLEADLADPETAKLHAPQPLALYAIGLAGMLGAAAHYAQPTEYTFAVQ